jgi:uncharacterized membrane protein YebE (DUF533 family)
MNKKYIIAGGTIALLLGVLIYLHFHNKKKDKAEKKPDKKTHTPKPAKNQGNTGNKGIMETDPGMSQQILNTDVVMDSEGGHSIMPKGANVNTDNPLQDILNLQTL